VRKNIYERRGLEKMSSVALASIEASVLATVVTQPVWVVKTRMVLNVNRRISEYDNCKQQISEIYRQHGAKGFLKGLQLSLLLSTTGVVQMYLYEGAKLLYDRLGVPQSQFEEKSLICGGISKVASVFVSYPLTTIRTRIQQNQFVGSRREVKYRGSWEVARRTLGEEGVRGLFKGMSANLLRGVGQKGIYFYCYEILKGVMVGKEEETQ
jgi:solute carrier family 25 (mitochondrial folate transporter), member 32